jgi:hypothetical protein
VSMSELDRERPPGLQANCLTQLMSGCPFPYNSCPECLARSTPGSAAAGYPKVAQDGITAQPGVYWLEMSA